MYRTAIEDFGFTDGFDPTGEHAGTAWGLYSQLLLRTLLTYRHVAGPAGEQVVPDLATSVPAPTDGGLTYTFHLKAGVRFGPPLDRPITSRDIAYAFQRINTRSLMAQYGSSYDGVIQGMDGNAAAPEDPVSGISTPDDSTIVFHLVRPTGDFPYRLTLPATAPTPVEVGRCFTKFGTYGRDLIASGPYMLAGEQDLNVSSCSAIEPIGGFDPTSRLAVVRNPSYDPRTDDPTVRENNVDGVSIVIDTNPSDIFRRIRSGQLDGSFAGLPPVDELGADLADPALQPGVHIDPGNETTYLFMNLLVPPFDDVHVRRAVAWLIPKASMLRAGGGPDTGAIATHVLPPIVLPFSGPSYDPYPSVGGDGDLARARAEMAMSRYDANHDGRCDPPVCTDVLYVSPLVTPYPSYTALIEAALARIGIHLKPRELDTGTAYTTVAFVKSLIPIGVATAATDYPDPFTFMAPLFGSAGIICVGESNFAEVGMNPELASRCGVSSTYRAALRHDGETYPSIDADINRCAPLVGAARSACWEGVDRKLMEDVVPWVPFLWGSHVSITGATVTKYGFDQFSGIVSLCHIAVENGISPPNG